MARVRVTVSFSCCCVACVASVSLGVFVPWWHNWRWTHWQWSSLCGGCFQAILGAVLLVIFGAFECVCAAVAERACVWRGLHQCRVVVCGTDGRCPCLVGCPSVVGFMLLWLVRD
ncbi:hypothetical protein Taro_048962 [Colocasia esculenta]|uniref:Uncharacterized protein n=1 Tax=Colocasia esculenta TaxID=4460 RepID=A0A843X9H9_COLES|nr:hypothetical protein [Colocasia esculenta]